ncbi:uncharacterized protein LOC128185340 [Crassostrea angulata]|uniref:uncharacterized protein LOC128185340 n=1 Tax=Magallana angulata TaxID=2784310 RepID=UPI0022B1C30A|nr:uncharacterized protein LOC128185340 [Crassostrea angulata]
MEDILSLLIVSVFLLTTRGQCPLNVGNKLITTCSETWAYGPLIYIDFHKINCPCNCTVTSTFTGDVLVTAQKTIISPCSTQVVVNGSRIFGCPLSRGTSVTFTLLKYHSIAVQAEFTPPSSSGTFYQCLGFQQNGTTTRRSYTASPTGKTRYPVISSTKKRTSPVTSTTRTTTSSLTSTTRKTTIPLTVKTGKTTSPVTSTRKITCPLSPTTSKIKLTSTSQSAIAENTTTNR